MEEVSLSDLDAQGEAICVSGAYKRFGSKGYTLRGLNMTVKQGTIYGLLGPSGCGKTTLLGCLTGSLKLDGGTIRMEINQSSQMGYMPQNLALFQEFSIKEHLMFYGSIHSMKKSQILEEAEKLKEFLELPMLDTVVSTLSGGQQRRVSLCIAFLHNPEVLILDEPTVGTDVVLSESIWDKLVEMSTAERKTIIITTHYIQEARRSNTIGLMRNGQILAEDDPVELMREHDSSSLEVVFLKLCRRELLLNDYGDQDFPDNNKLESAKSDYNLFHRTWLKWNRVRAYSMKSVIWMRRNITLVLFTLLLPIVQCTLISLSVGEDPKGLKLGVVNEETLEITMALSNGTECISNSTLSREFLSILQGKGMNLVEYRNVDEALRAAKKNYVWGVAYLNQNYSSFVHERLEKGVKASNEAINGSEVLVWLDMSSVYDQPFVHNDGSKIVPHHTIVNQIVEIQVHFHTNKLIGTSYGLSDVEFVVLRCVSCCGNEVNWKWGRLHIGSGYTGCSLVFLCQIIGKVLKERIRETTLELLANVIKRCSFSSIQPGTLAKEYTVYGAQHPSFRQFMTPANAVLFAFYLPMMFTLGAMLMEKTSGLLERSLVAGLTILEVAIGHIILQVVILAAQTAFMMIVLYCAFDNPMVPSSVVWCVLFLLLVGVCGMFYGFFVAALCDSFTTAACLAIGSYFPLFMLSGAIWPLEGMYPFLRVVSAFLPVTSAVEAYRSISVRSWTLAYSQVYVSVISLTIWTLIFGILTVVMIKWRVG